VKDVQSGDATGSAGEQHWGVTPCSATYAPSASTSHLKRYVTSHNCSAMDGAVKASFATLVMPTNGTAAGRSLRAEGATARPTHAYELHVELLRRSTFGHFVTTFAHNFSAGAVRLRIRDTASQAESVIVPMEYDAGQLAYASHHDVLRSNFTGINPSFAFFAHKRHPAAKPVHTFVSLHDDHRVLPTFHSGVGESEWREHVMPFYHHYWRAWIHSKVAPYPFKRSLKDRFQTAARAAGRRVPALEARKLSWFHTGEDDAANFGVESTAEELGESVSEGSGTLVGVAAGAILDRHEWAENPGKEAIKTTAEVGAEMAGGAAGDAVGGAAGAAIGAAIGGPVGAVAGEEIGSVVGERVGQFAGSEVAEHANEIRHVASSASHFVHHHFHFGR